MNMFSSRHDALCYDCLAASCPIRQVDLGGGEAVWLRWNCCAKSLVFPFRLDATRRWQAVASFSPLHSYPKIARNVSSQPVSCENCDDLEVKDRVSFTKLEALGC